MSSSTQNLVEPSFFDGHAIAPIEREMPRCAHFGECGGCAFQDLAYLSTQVPRKAQMLSEAFGLPVKVVPSPGDYEYRNRMDFVCAFGKVGLRMKGSFRKVIGIGHCHLVPARVSHLLERLRRAAAENAIPDYDYLRQEGYLRYIVIRAAHFTPDLLVSFVTAARDERILPLVKAAKGLATSIHWLFNDGLADQSFGEIVKFFGKDHLEEKIGPITFQLGPNTFFQNNPALMVNLIGHIQSLVRGKVLDLFSGMGAISLSVAQGVESVLGVEQVSESVEFAEKNAARNGIKNAEFLCSGVREWLITQRENVGAFDTVIVDPPRSGFGKKIARKIVRLVPERLIYVSCNPKTFLLDFKELQEGYKIKEVLGFDMFPQTPHVELVALLTRI